MNLAELMAATTYHSTREPRSCYYGPREILASDAMPVADQMDINLTRVESDARRDWRSRDTGFPGQDLPVRWDGDLSEAWTRFSSMDRDSLSELYRSLVGRNVPKRYETRRLTAVVWQINATVADCTARLANR
jgi:hypothetical protein